MSKQVFFGVAGSGKTKKIMDKLDSDKRSLVITYTKNNLENIRSRVCKKLGCIPNNITLMTYFEFLYSFCFRPQLAMRSGIVGVNYAPSHKIPRYTKGCNLNHYVDKNRRLYGCRISKLLINQESVIGLQDGGHIEKDSLMSAVSDRLEKYYDEFLFDEVQDLASHDFNFVLEITKCRVSVLMVGDFYQHTFDTSRDGTTNGSLHEEYDNYQKRFRDVGLETNTESLSTSYRCGQEVCAIVGDNLGIKMSSSKRGATNVEFIADNDANAQKIVADRNIVKLFYDSCDKYRCISDNWGNSKGREYKKVCVVLNKPASAAINESNKDIAPRTRNKLYVALTRASENLYLLNGSSQAIKSVGL